MDVRSSTPAHRPRDANDSRRMFCWLNHERKQLSAECRLHIRDTGKNAHHASFATVNFTQHHRHFTATCTSHHVGLYTVCTFQSCPSYMCHAALTCESQAVQACLECHVRSACASSIEIWRSLVMIGDIECTAVDRLQSVVERSPSEHCGVPPPCGSGKRSHHQNIVSLPLALFSIFNRVECIQLLSFIVKGLSIGM
jgi:hypothetical protein